MSVVDMHTHFLPKQWPDLTKRFGGGEWPWMRHTEPGKAMLMLGDKDFQPCTQIRREKKDNEDQYCTKKEDYL